MTQAVALFVIETQCVGAVLIVVSILGLIGIGIMWDALRNAPMIEDTPLEKGVSDIRP